MSLKAMTEALAIGGVSSSEKLLLLALANYADEHGRCYPSQARLAKDTCLSDRTIRSLLAALEERELLSRQERQRPDGSRASDIITLTFAAPVDAEISGGAEMVSGGVRKPLPGGAEMVSALTSFEPVTEPADVVDWRARLDEATSIAGDQLDRTATAVHHARDLRLLCEPAAGNVPCEWGEVLDAIRIAAARAKTRGKPIRSWLWVKDDALALRDRRLAGLPPPKDPADVRSDHPRRPTPREDRLGRMLGGLVAATDGA